MQDLMGFVAVGLAEVFGIDGLDRRVLMRLAQLFALVDGVFLPFFLGMLLLLSHISRV